MWETLTMCLVFSSILLTQNIENMCSDVARSTATISLSRRCECVRYEWAYFWRETMKGCTYNKQLTYKYCLVEKISLTFLSEQAYFASWHQCCRYVRQSTKHMQQNSGNAYNYYVKLLLGLIGVYSASWFNN